MRIYISADIEGIAGVVTTAQTNSDGFEYEQARDWMTSAVLTACETVKTLGADEVVVSDSHGNGQNIRYERMPSYVKLVRSWPRPLGMMQGIEVGQYDGAFLIGYHAGATNMGGVLSHTISSFLFQEIKINGRVIPEAGISAAIGGHFDVPTLLIAGDDVAVAETTDFLGDIAVATLKVSYGTLSALNISPADAEEALRAGCHAAIKKIDQIRPFKIAAPIELDIRLRNRSIAEWLNALSVIERIDAYTIRYRAEDMPSVSRFLSFLTSGRTVYS